MNRRFLVAATDYLVESEHESKVLNDIADIRLLRAANEREVIERVPEAQALLVFHDMKLGEATMAGLPELCGIVRVGVGFDNVDLAAAGARGIVVCNVPDYGTEDVADHALLMLLAIVRRLVPSHDMIRAGGWDPSVIYGAPRLRGQTLGIIGCGRIGTAMALRSKVLGMRVVFYDPYVEPGYEKALGVERAYQFEELLPQCQFVSVHTPHTPQTRHILNARSLSLLPMGAYVVNTARGPCIDAEGLLEALSSGRVAYAALDVLEREPLDDDRLRHHPKVLLTPHTAFYSVEGYIEMRRKAAEEIRRVLLNEPVRNPVNLPFLKNPRCAISPARR